MEEMISSMFREEGYDLEEITFHHWADLRYLGQSFELTISIEKPNRIEGLAVNLRRDFEVEHERTFGHCSSEEQVELVSLRVSGRIRSISPAWRGPCTLSHCLEFSGKTAGLLRTDYRVLRNAGH